MASIRSDYRTQAQPGLPANGQTAHPADGELSDFDLRDALAHTTVRETSYAEFLDAMHRQQHRPA